MDAILLQILNGLDKGSAYALIALGLTLIFGTLGVVNFAHGALFMIGAFCAVTFTNLLTWSHVVIDDTRKDFLGNPMKVDVPYIIDWFGKETGEALIDWAVPLSILFAIPVMIAIGFIMERGLIKHFYKRPHADQILVTFGLAIVLQEVIKYFYGANPIPTPAPAVFAGSFDFGAMLGFDPNTIIYPYWRLIYFAFSALIIGAVFAFLQFTTLRRLSRDWQVLCMRRSTRPTIIWVWIFWCSALLWWLSAAWGHSAARCWRVSFWASSRALPLWPWCWSSFRASTRSSSTLLRSSFC